MPYLTVQTNVADSQITDALLKELSGKLAEVVGKPEQYVCIHIAGGQRIFFAGTAEPAAFMELVCIGLSASQTENITKEIMTFFEEKLAVKASRTYIKFTPIAGNMIGWNKGTF